MANVVRIVDETGIDAALDAQIRAFLVRCFPGDAASFRKSRGWHGSMPAFSVLLEVDDQLIGHIGVVDRSLRVGDQPLRVAGIQNVAVAPQERGRRLVDQVMNVAMAEAKHRGFDAGMLFCDELLCPIYSRSGWTLTGSRTVWQRRDGGREIRLQTANVMMHCPLGRIDFPAGDVHLDGNDW